MMGIYEIINLDDGKATAYVGSSVDIRGRWGHHKARLQRNIHHNFHLQNAWNKYGAAAFEWCVIEEVGDEDVLLEREQYWLDRYFENPGRCYNIARCAEAPWRGTTLSEEHRRKLSRAHEGQIPWNTGKARSKTTRRKISRALSGEKHPNWGKCHSKETRRRISASRGRPYPAFIHREAGAIILPGRNLTDMCERHNLNRSAMCQVKSGMREHHRGWELL